MKLNQESFKETIAQLYPEAVFQDATRQMHFNIQIENIPFPTFFRLYDYGDLMQVVSFLPCRLTTPASVNDTSRLLHFLNKQMDLPGFGIDEASGTVFYRTVLRGKDNIIDDAVIQNEIETVKKIIKAFAGAVISVAAAKLTFQEFLQKATIQKVAEGQSQQPAPEEDNPASASGKKKEKGRATSQ